MVVAGGRGEGDMVHDLSPVAVYASDTYSTYNILSFVLIL